MQLSDINLHQLLLSVSFDKSFLRQVKAAEIYLLSLNYSKFAFVIVILYLIDCQMVKLFLGGVDAVRKLRLPTFSIIS